MPNDYEGTLAKVAGIGYKEVEAFDPYNNMEPKQYRALLDRYGLTMPSTHSGAIDVWETRSGVTRSSNGPSSSPPGVLTRPISEPVALRPETL